MFNVDWLGVGVARVRPESRDRDGSSLVVAVRHSAWFGMLFGLGFLRKLLSSLFG